MAGQKKSLVFGTRVGLLGGGQLARMLALKGQELGLEMHVLSPDASDPAAQVTRFWEQGSPAKPEDVAAFFSKVDVVTVESEFHHAPLLAEASRKSGTPLFPEPGILALLQDRLPQKELMEEYGLPTAPFRSVANTADLKSAAAFFKNRFVLKKRRGGYDGYGTFVVRSAKDAEKLTTTLDPGKEPCIAEAFVPFRRELSLVASRSRSGEMAFLPLVETRQVDSRLDWLQGPVRHRGLPAFQEKVAAFLKKTDYVGTIAFELFETAEGRLVVNEIAPRVHNSGHASLEATEADQFRLHLLAILGQSLSVELKSPAFAMVNLIGQGASSPSAPAKLGGHLHWYGKTESRKGRKMGHVTYVGKNAADLLKTALRERKGFKL